MCESVLGTRPWLYTQTDRPSQNPSIDHQEERKVELLSARLAELGVDAAAIVAGVGGDDLT